MIKEKKREEIKEEDKWDLTKIYKNEKDWEKDLKDLQKEMEEIPKMKSHITESAKSLKKYLETSTDIDRKLSKVYYYANLHHDEDTTNTKYQKMMGKVDTLLTQYGELSSFVDSEMMKTPYSTIQEYIKEDKDLEKYKHNLEDFYRYQEHILTEEQEKVLSSFSLVLESSSDIFKALTNADMEFGQLTLEDGTKVELNESNYSIYIRSKDRKVRKQAFQMLMNAYAKHKNTLGNIYKSHVEYQVQSAKVHRFPSALESSLYKDNIDKKVYDNIIDTVSKNLKIAYKYFDMKKDVLKLKEIHNYDIYAELEPEEETKFYEFDEAKELVKKALAPLGEDYLKHLERAFEEKWIDKYHNKGKRGGAYSSGYYDIPPYVLLNYEGKLDDVSTLAHELGHSMHSLYSWENNPYETSSYRIFVAEVASTVNELFLSKYLLKESKDKKEKRKILNNLMELFKGTIIRQTMFAEFEKITHEAREKGEVLTHDYLSEEYFKLNQKYFGPNVTLDEEIKYEWMRIPHFYYNFYVYKYVVGLSCACYIVESILAGKENARENYLKFLSTGGSMYPAEELKIAGIDITSKEVIESALHMFEDTIEEYKKLREN